MQTNNLPRTPKINSSRRHKPDYLLLVISAVLLGISLIIIYSISPALGAENGNLGTNYFVIRHLVSIFLGVILFVFFANCRGNLLKNIALPLLVTGLILALFTIIFGGIGNRWIQFGQFSFQPAEVIKLGSILWLGHLIVDRMRKSETASRDLLKIVGFALIVLSGVIVVLQKDLGSMMVIVTIFFAMIYMSGYPIFKIAVVGLAMLGLVFFAISSTPYRRDRLQTFLNQEVDCSNEGYHACQALLAVGSGGLIGKGMNNSVQAYGYLPEPSNDSIFAIYAEKFGFIGNIILVSVFGLLIKRLLDIMNKLKEPQYRLIIVGIITWFFIQAFINISAMIGLLPLKGITLPFLSYGGSSIMLVMGALGVAFQLSSYTEFSAVPMDEIVSTNSNNDQNQRRNTNESISQRGRVWGSYNSRPRRYR